MMTSTDDYYSHVRSEIFPHVPRGGRLLDVGGGNGATASALRTSGHADRVGTVDMVAPSAAGKLDFSHQGDLSDAALIDRIGAEEGPFDTILCLDILEHLVDPWETVAYLHRILAPGGCIVASIPNVRHYSALAPLVAKGQWQYEAAGILDRTHLRFFVRDSAVALMTCSGLRLEQVVALPPGRRRDRLLDQASLGLLRPFLTQQYMVRVRRD